MFSVKLKLIMIMVVVMLFVMIGSVEADVVNGSDSAYTFNVTNCMANDTYVGCDAEVVRFNCSIDNYMFIDYVRFLVDDSLYFTSRNDTHFWYDWTKAADTGNANESIGLTREYITDTNFNTVIAFEEALITHECGAFCPANFSIITGGCLTNDTRIVQHISDNEVCQASYNESISCDYCTSDWTLRTTGIYACLVNNTQLKYYDDFNVCCALTNLTDDCTEPFDHDTVASCSFYDEALVVSCDSEPYMDKKIECTVEISNTTNEYDCITYIKQNESYLQTNPQKKSYTAGLTTLFAKEIETRDTFTTQNGLANVYYTNKNLVAYTDFTLGVRCTSQSAGETLLYEQTITPTYKDLDVFDTRGLWAIDNMTYILLGGLVIFFIIVLLFLGLKIAMGK